MVPHEGGSACWDPRATLAWLSKLALPAVRTWQGQRFSAAEAAPMLTSVPAVVKALAELEADVRVAPLEMAGEGVVTYLVSSKGVVLGLLKFKSLGYLWLRRLREHAK